MTDAVIVAARRTPTGKRESVLSGIHPADLGAHSLRALVDRTGIDPGAVDDVILGCVDPVGAQAGACGAHGCHSPRRGRPGEG